MIESQLEGLERSPKEELERKQEIIRRALQAGRARFEVIIADRPEHVQLDTGNRMHRITQYAAIALGSFDHPNFPEQSNQLLAVPTVHEQTRDHETAAEYSKPVRTKYSIHLQAVNGDYGPDTLRHVAEYAIPASDEVPQTTPVCVESAQQFEHITEELIGYVAKEGK